MMDIVSACRCLRDQSVLEWRSRYHLRTSDTIESSVFLTLTLWVWYHPIPPDRLQIEGTLLTVSVLDLQSDVLPIVVKAL